MSGTCGDADFSVGYHHGIATAEFNPDSLRLQTLQRGRRFALPVPDALMALVFVAAALLELFPSIPLPAFLVEARNELVFVLLVEGGFLMAQGTLVDIATRLRKRPPVWLAALIVAGVILLSHYTWDVLRMAWERGSLVFVPLLVSIAERGTVLWRMPGRPKTEKIAARALIANRITTGLALFGLVTVAMVIGTVFRDLYDFDMYGGMIVLMAGALYFGIAAFDDWRVRGPKFAERPRVLFRWDAIGIDYLEPL